VNAEQAAVLAALDDPDALVAAVDALGDVWEPGSAAVLLDRVPLAHPDARVRLALVRALPGGAVAAGGALAGRVVDALVTLTRDDEPRVRDWAAFGLDLGEADTPAVRDALVVLLDDRDPETRAEALLALASTGDDRARTALLARLGSGTDLTLLELKAAVALADPALHPELLRLADDWAGDDDDFTPLLDAALARSRPGAGDDARAAEAAVVEEVRRAVPGLARLELRGAYPRTVLVAARESGDAAVHVLLWARGEDPGGDRRAAVVAAVVEGLPPR
jgi:HEAT repeat protein